MRHSAVLFLIKVKEINCDNTTKPVIFEKMDEELRTILFK